MMVYIGKPVDPKYMFHPIAEAQFVREGTIADLRFDKEGVMSRYVWRATWCERNGVTAWWPAQNAKKQDPIGLYEPSAFRIVAIGFGGDGRAKNRGQNPG